MKRKPRTTDSDYWRGEAKRLMQVNAEQFAEIQKMLLEAIRKAELIDELKADNDREFTAGGRYAVAKAIEAAERWGQAAGRILGDCEIKPEVERVVKAVKLFTEGAISPLEAAASRMRANEWDYQEPDADHSGKTAADL